MFGKPDGTLLYNGYAAEFAVFGRSLSPQEISQYYLWATSAPKRSWYFGGSIQVPTSRRLLIAQW